MKRILAGSILALGLMHQSIAMAGDWTGFYAGLNAGAGWDSSSFQVKPTGCFLTGECGGSPALNPQRSYNNNLDSGHFVGGGQVGYNYQFYNNQIVAGLELDLNYIGINDSEATNKLLTAPLSGRFQPKVNQEFDWFSTLRLRFGGLTCSNWYLYGTGGLAYAHYNTSSRIAFTEGGDIYSGTESSNKGGIAVGAGAEYAFDNCWSARIEYLYVDLNSVSYTDRGNVLAPPAATYNTSIGTRDNMIRLAVNYKFWD